MVTFVCPNCGLVLAGETTAQCVNGHCFDRAREGYLNLLIGGRLPSAEVRGDSPDALVARRRFLAGGHYRPIAASMAEMLGLPAGPVLDVGCGEGYYLSTLDPLAVPQEHCGGVDIAKAAVRMAARAMPKASFAVASAYRLPVADSSIAAVVSVFGPRPFEEFQRVLRDGGVWVAVTPAGNHLQQLRPALSDTAQRKAAARAQRRMAPPEEAAAAQRVSYTLTLDDAAASDLLHMTPIRWQHDGHAAATTTVREVTVDVWVSRSRA